MLVPGNIFFCILPSYLKDKILEENKAQQIESNDKELLSVLIEKNPTNTKEKTNKTKIYNKNKN